MTTRGLDRIAAALAFALLLLAPAGASAVGLAKTCGGLPAIACDAGLFCERPAGRCGAADSTGSCVKPGEICTQLYQPVCGCDGKTYGNDCTRRAAKVSKRQDGPCQ